MSRAPTRDADGLRRDAPQGPSGFSERAKKHLGQNFLHEKGVVEKIVQAIDPRPGDRIVEIGPGQGALTLPLLDRHGALTAIEFDRDLLAPLAQAAQAHGTLTLVPADVLTVDFSTLAAGLGADDGRIRLVGNLPYNLSSPILFHALDHAAAIRDMHFMLQKEVVDRMAASPGSKAFGRLSVMLQWRYEIEALFDVGPEAFDPPPKVDSAIVSMIPRPADVASQVDAAVLGQLVTVAFSQRRKILRHTLGRWLEEHGYAGDFDAQRRAEEVPVAEYLALAKAVTPARADPPTQ